MANPIRIIVNGFEETVQPGMAVSRIIAHFKEGDADLIVEHNGRFVYPAKYDETFVSEGDRIEFINPNFGG